MTVDELVGILDDHGFEDTLDTRKIEALNTAYHEICAQEPWPFLEATTDATIDTSTGKVTAPATGAVRAVTRFFADPLGRLDWIRRDEFLDLYFPDTDLDGDPFLYFFIGQDIYVYPIPAADPSTVLDYLKVEDELESGGAETTILLPPRHHKIIAYRALVDLYTMEDDPELAASFNALYQDKLARMYGDLMRQQYDRPLTVKYVDDGFGFVA